MTALQAGQLLDGTVYQVVREIGAGGMGVVYEVEHVRLKKRYVAKVIHDQVRGDEGVQKRMEREAHVLAEINHPNIVQVHDVGTMPDGTSYFVMEKLEGMDLRAAIQRGGVGRARALSIVIDVLDALTHVHQRGIVHRDIKPENVYLARQPTGAITKVLDFGIVHIFDGDGSASQNRITKTGGFVGTLYYAAPEQMQGMPAAPANDVYAAALVLFELIAGRGPFDDDPGVGLSRCFKPAPRIDAVAANVSPDLAAAIADALEQDPARRPTAAAFAGRLRNVLAIATTTPGGSEVLQADVDDLLHNMPLASSAKPGELQTAMPPTPLMAGAPGRVSAFPSMALNPTVASPSPFAPGTTGPAVVPTLGSGVYAPAISQPPPAHYPTAYSSQVPIQGPHGDTSPGVYATVDGPPSSLPLLPQRSAFNLVSTGVAVVIILAIGVGATVKILHDKSTATVTASAPSAPIVIAAPPPPLAEPPTPALETAKPEPSAAPSATATATATARQAPKPAAKGHAAQDGYVDHL